ncbi:MAG: DUF1707 domain-containing protein [Actinomycetota bacterium]
MTTSSGGTPPLRIGNHERRAAYAALDAHLDGGRLDADEYGERYAKATMARTREELDVLFLDLPAPHPMKPARATKNVAWTLATGPWQRYLPASVVGRIAAAIVLVAALCFLIPVAAAGALVWFVVIPMLTGRGCGRRRHDRTWSQSAAR